MHEMDGWIPMDDLAGWVQVDYSAASQAVTGVHCAVLGGHWARTCIRWMDGTGRLVTPPRALFPPKAKQKAKFGEQM